MVVMYCCYTQGMIPPFRQAQYTHCNTLRPRATTGTTRTQAPPLMDELLFILSLSNNSSFNHNPFSVRWIYMSCILPGSIEEIRIELMRAIPDYARRPPVPVPQGRPLLPDNSQSRWWWSCQSARRTTGSHVPDLVTRPRDHDQRRPENRKRCKYCICVRTSLYCSNCQVFLCGGACWQAWHSLRELPPAEEMRRVVPEPDDDE